MSQQMTTQQVRDELREVLTTQDPPAGFASLRNYLLGRGEELISHLYHPDATPAGSLLQERPAAPPLADGELSYLASCERAATSGKWRIEFDIEDNKVTDKHIGIENEAGCLVIRDDWGFATQEDFEFICAARNTVPAMLAENAQLRANLAAALNTLNLHNAAASQPLELLGVAAPNAKSALANDAERKYLGEVFDCLPDSMSDFLDDFLRRLTPALPAASPSTIGGSGAWISVDERLPEIDGVWSDYVLVVLKNGFKAIAQLLSNGGWFFPATGQKEPEDNKITHWQPLPATPSQKAQ